LLPNVVSARVHQKRERARVEALLERYAEPLVALVPGATGGVRELERAWTVLLWNGAHDSVCGCSHDQVGRDVDMRHAEARGLAEGLVQDALTTLGSATADRGTLWFNPSPFERDGIPGLGWVVQPGRGPAKGSPSETIPVPLEAAGRGIVANGVELAFVDEPDVGDLYNFCPAEGQHPSPPDSVEVEGDRARITWRGLDVSIRVAQGRGDAVLRVEGDIENRRPDHRLRVHVRLPSDVDHVIAGSPFELVTRGLTSEGGELEQASPTWPARGVVLAGELAVLQEGVFEYEIVEGRWLAITVLRCVGTISRPVLATRPFRAGPDVPTPDAQMIGSTPFAFGVWRGGAGGRSISSASRSGRVLGDLLEAWERFALPLVGGVASGEGTLPSPGSLLDVRGDAELSSIRRRGPDAEVRLWNPYRDRDVAATVAGRPIRLRPAEIATVTLPRAPAFGA
jgi:hypothetical protein